MTLTPSNSHRKGSSLDQSAFVDFGVSPGGGGEVRFGQIALGLSVNLAKASKPRFIR